MTMQKDQRLHDYQFKAFAYHNSDGSFDLESISETVDGVKYKMLEAVMGWRFNIETKDKELGQ